MIADFSYCPNCGTQETFTPFADNAYQCSQCGFLLYLNAAAAVAAILTCKEKILLAVRGTEPDAGKFDLPGGFVDNGESAEQAIVREINEELGVIIQTPSYFGSYPNTYPYKGIRYHTVDFIYLYEFDQIPHLKAMDDVAGYCWVDKAHIPLDQVAFVSLRNALVDYQKCYGKGQLKRSLQVMPHNKAIDRQPL